MKKNIPAFFIRVSAALLFTAVSALAQPKQDKNDTIFFDKEKKLAQTMTIYDGDKMTITNFTRDGNKYSEEISVSRKRQSFVSWFADGKKSSEIIYDKGLKISFKKWFISGKEELEENSKIVKKDSNLVSMLHGKYFQNFQSGERSQEGNYFEGKKSGEWVDYYEGGIKKAMNTFKDGIRNGKCEFWYKSGKKGWERNYITITVKEKPREVIDGKEILYFESGNKQKEANYIQGKKNGLMEEWYENGTKKAECELKDDYSFGKNNSWFENGNVKKIETYFMVYDSLKRQFTTKREGKFETHYDNGNLQQTGSYIDNQKDGLWTEYFQSGQKGSENTFVKGLQTGKSTNWNKEGKIIVSQGFTIIEKNGKSISVQDGEITRTADNGTITLKGLYKKGKLEGPWNQWYADGNKLEEVNYVDGAKAGKDILYNSGNGSFRDERTFVLRKEKDSTWSVLEGEQKSYDKDGKVIRVNFFVNGKIGNQSREFYDDGNLKCEIYHLIFSEYGNSQNGFTRTFFGNGKLESDIFNYNGRTIGRSLNYFINGNLKSLTDLNVNGAKYGYEIQWGSDGDLVSFRKNIAYNKFDEIHNKKLAQEIYDSVMSRPVSPKIKDGHYVTWFDKAHKQYETDFKDGKINGLFTAYYADGKKLVELEMKDGTANGKFCIWNMNGNKYQEGNYLMGELSGTWNFYLENGSKEKEIGYTEGEKMFTMQKEWYPNGNQKSEAHYKNGRQDGHFANWTEAGVLQSESDWIDGKSQGKMNSLYPNGKPRYEHSFKDGKQEGVSIEFYESGQKSSEYYFVKGKKEGPVKMWWPNGKVKATGVYHNDEMDSVWVNYLENGTERNKNIYNKGILYRAPSGRMCECIDSTKGKIGFAPMVNGLATLDAVHKGSFNFHAPIDEFYDHLFYLNLQSDNNRDASFYSFDIIAYQPIYIKVPDEQGIKLIFNPCINTGSLESRTGFNISTQSSDKKETRVSIYPNNMSIAFDSKLLHQWDKKTNAAFLDDKNKEVAAAILFKTKSVEYNENDHLKINSISSPCFPTSEIGKSGMLLDFKNFYPDLDVTKNPYELNAAFPNKYYEYYFEADGNEKKKIKTENFQKEPSAKFTGVFVPEAVLTLPQGILRNQTKPVEVRCTELLISGQYLVGTIKLKVKLADGMNYAFDFKDQKMIFTAETIQQAFTAKGFQKVVALFDTEKSEMSVYFYYSAN